MSTANTLVQQYGAEDALLMAAKRADALLELGDVEGQEGGAQCPLPASMVQEPDHKHPPSQKGI